MAGERDWAPPVGAVGEGLPRGVGSASGSVARRGARIPFDDPETGGSVSVGKSRSRSAGVNGSGRVAPATDAPGRRVGKERLSPRGRKSCARLVFEGGRGPAVRTPRESAMRISSSFVGNGTKVPGFGGEYAVSGTGPTNSAPRDADFGTVHRRQSASAPVATADAAARPIPLMGPDPDGSRALRGRGGRGRWAGSREGAVRT